jgi:hypothetical protein
MPQHKFIHNLLTVLVEAANSSTEFSRDGLTDHMKVSTDAACGNVTPLRSALYDRCSVQTSINNLKRRGQNQGT